jgi:hypothetical protein
MHVDGSDSELESSVESSTHHRASSCSQGGSWCSMLNVELQGYREKRLKKADGVSWTTSTGDFSFSLSSIFTKQNFIDITLNLNDNRRCQTTQITPDHPRFVVFDPFLSTLNVNSDFQGSITVKWRNWTTPAARGNSDERQGTFSYIFHSFSFTLAFLFLFTSFFCYANHYLQFRLDYIYGMKIDNDESPATKDDERLTEA